MSGDSGGRTRTAVGAETTPGHVVTDAPRSSAFEVGALLAERYRIRRFLGRGGMGEVYEADDEELNRRVAIKVLIAALFDEERATTLLRRELAAARRVTHPNVCRVYDLSYHREANGRATALYSMELLEGENLADRLQRRGRLSSDECLPIVEQVCAGLAAAHGAGVIHRDLKPHNVILCDERAVVVDFGLAVALEAGDPTRSMELMGTPAYMAPEQVEGRRISSATDSFALGVTLFELVTGELPFTASSPLGAALARVKADAPRADSRRPDLDPRWTDVIARCLARDPTTRPSPDEIIAALRGAALPSRRPRRARFGRRSALFALAGVAMFAVIAAVALWRRGANAAWPQVMESFDTGPVARVLRLSGPGKDKIEGAARDEEGNVYVVGHAGTGARLGDVELASAGRPALAFVARIDREGRLRWVRTFPARSKISLSSVAVDGDQVYAAGHVESGEYDLGDGDRTVDATALGFVLSLSVADGSDRWRKRLSTAAEDNVRAIAVGPDGHLYVVGDYSGATDFGDGVSRTPTTTAPFAASYDRDGVLRWVVAGRAGGNVRGRALGFAGGAVLVGGSAAGEVEFGGSTWSAGVIRRGFVAAIDQRSGTPRWVRHFDTASEVWAIAPESDDSVIVGGGFHDRLQLVPGEVLEAAPDRNRPFVASLALDGGTPRRAVTIDREATEGWSARMLAPLPDGRWLVGGAFGGGLASGSDRRSARGEVDGYLAVVDAAARVEQLAVITGPGTERLRGASAVGPGLVAVWGRHDGATLGTREIPSRGLSDGIYAELRLEQLFR